MSINQENHSLKTNLVINFIVNQKSVTVPRFWICSNKDEFTNMVNFVSNIDLVVHPEAKSFPAIFELTENKGPELKEVSEVYFKNCLENHKNTMIMYQDQYTQKFNK